MLYVFVIKKNKGDIAPFALSDILNKYATIFNNDIVISFPGYMSKKRKTITDFRKNLKLTNNVYFTEGMNGNSNLLDVVGVKIQDEYNNQYGSKMAKIISKKDHSKILFFLDPKSKGEDSVIVKAILIGSSNQSYESYFNTPAKKGEADVFIVDGATIEKDDKRVEERLVSIYNELDETIRKNVILTKEISKGNPEYLNDLFKKITS
ncbi:MAG: hypothetical protein J6C61_01740 [Clostridia bacterium]|nr:hypothetical protein [Clostridia bacterium]